MVGRTVRSPMTEFGGDSLPPVVPGPVEALSRAVSMDVSLKHKFFFHID